MLQLAKTLFLLEEVFSNAESFNPITRHGRAAIVPGSHWDEAFLCVCAHPGVGTRVLSAERN